MNFWKQSIAIGAAIAFGTITTALLVPRPDLPPMVAEISFKNAKKIKDALWIDARSESEFSKGHVPGALLLNEDDWSRKIAGVLEKWTPGQTVIIYCGAPTCNASRAVARRLQSPEYALTNIFILKGGWSKNTQPWNPIQ